MCEKKMKLLIMNLFLLRGDRNKEKLLIELFELMKKSIEFLEIEWKWQRPRRRETLSFDSSDVGMERRAGLTLSNDSERMPH